MFEGIVWIRRCNKKITNKLFAYPVWVYGLSAVPSTEREQPFDRVTRRNLGSPGVDVWQKPWITIGRVVRTVLFTQISESLFFSLLANLEAFRLARSFLFDMGSFPRAAFWKRLWSQLAESYGLSFLHKSANPSFFLCSRILKLSASPVHFFSIWDHSRGLLIEKVFDHNWPHTDCRFFREIMFQLSPSPYPYQVSFPRNQCARKTDLDPYSICESSINRIRFNVSRSSIVCSRTCHVVPSYTIERVSLLSYTIVLIESRSPETGNDPNSLATPIRFLFLA